MTARARAGSRSSPARRRDRFIALALGALGWPVSLGARRADQLEETAAPSPMRAAPRTTRSTCATRIDRRASLPPRPRSVRSTSSSTRVPPPGAHDERRAARTHPRRISGPILVTKRAVADLRPERPATSCLPLRRDGHPRPYSYLQRAEGRPSRTHHPLDECEASRSDRRSWRRPDAHRLRRRLGYGDSPRSSRTGSGSGSSASTRCSPPTSPAVATTVTAPPHMWIAVGECRPPPSP